MSNYELEMFLEFLGGLAEFVLGVCLQVGIALIGYWIAWNYLIKPDIATMLHP